MFVPILQGLYREAWEVDETMSHVHHGADGFVEVIEGWAFASAVLPRIAACDAAVAQKVVDNMQIRTSQAAPHNVAEGYEAVIAAVETTYDCLGITCADVNSMLSVFPDPAKNIPAGPPLWSACTAAAIPRKACTVSSSCTTSGAGTPALATLAVVLLSAAVHHLF